MTDPRPRQIAQSALEAAKAAIDAVVDAQTLPDDRREMFRDWVYDYVRTAAAFERWPA